MNVNYPIVWLLGTLILAGCATEKSLIPPPLVLPKKVAEHLSPGAVVPAQEAALDFRISETPKPPPPDKTQTGKPVPPAPAPTQEAANITLTFEQIPLPTLIQVVYSTILNRNVHVDPSIVARQDLVTLRTGAPQTPSQVTEAMRMLLKSYGVAVMDIGSLVRVVPDNTNLGYLPEIRRGRALPDTPLPLRPIFQLVELQSVRNTDVAAWIRSMFAGKVNLQEDTSRNAVLLSGNSDDVLAALEAIHVLDQPLMKGRRSMRINPVFWSAEELAKKLSEVLQAEGYSAGTTLQTNFPITLLPIQAINAIIVFTADPATMAHVIEWASELDNQSSSRRAGGGYFTYQARYADAQGLAKTLQELMSTAAPAAAGAAAPTAAKRPSRVVVNAATNSLIFQSNTEDYTQLLNLLQELDKPAKAALIEVTVAEVTLDDDTKLGVEWALNEAKVSGGLVQAATLGGLGIGTGGLTVRGLSSSGDVRLLLNALATNSRSNILSSPRILARNGETATIQVGEDVPTLTSSQTTTTTGGGVLQSIQYRNTGVVLKVKPVIHAGDRVELEVSQEVSSQVERKVEGLNSPIFSTRKVETQLSLKDGSTVLLGGLMSSDRTVSDSGIPLLKDIPVLGQLFRTNSDKGQKKELLILITPHIVADDHDAQAITEAFRNRLGAWAQVAPAPEKIMEKGMSMSMGLTTGKTKAKDSESEE